MDAEPAARAPAAGACAGGVPVGGHDVALFEAAVPEYALCPICYNVLIDPRSCQRGHRRVRVSQLGGGRKP